ncbi:MAG TPA: hypothetical protein VNG51_04655 [Ktedonobacteraceae bacterium]|nr:hypothetical protein [Ktedonobacteraceae bacterium]
MMSDTSNQPEQLQSRRKFFVWAGQLAAGFSIAGVGLGLLDPKAALAEPECTPCSGCVVVSCNESGACKAHNPATPLEIEYKLRLGCVPPGCTFSAPYYECNSSCACYY